MSRFVPPGILLLLLAPILVLASAGDVHATDVRFGEVRIDGESIVASVSIPGLVGPKTRARLESGQPFETTVRFYLYAGREWWPDEQLAVGSLRLAARYDAATQEYTVTGSVGNRALPPKKAHSLDELRTMLEVHDNLPVFAVVPAWRGERVFLRARVRLGTDYLLGIVPTENWSDRASSRRFPIP